MGLGGHRLGVETVVPLNPGNTHPVLGVPVAATPALGIKVLALLLPAVNGVQIAPVGQGDAEPVARSLNAKEPFLLSR